MLPQEKINCLCELVEYLTNKGFTDMSDASAEISFLEYGMLRNPETNRVIYCKPVDDVYENIVLDWSIVDLDDVKEYLEDIATTGFYSFIGSDRKVELDRLNRDYLSGIIEVINQYDGYFSQSCIWSYDIKAIKSVVESA